MPRFFTLKTAANDAVHTIKNGPTKSLLAYLLNTHGIDNEVNQNELASDLMRKQFVPLSEGGVIAKPNAVSLVKMFDLRKPEFIKKGYMTDRYALKVKAVVETKDMLKTRIAELEAAIAAK